MNDELIAGGPETVSKCFDLYKFHKQKKNKWTQSMERARKVVCAQIGDLNYEKVTHPLCEGIIEDRLKLGLAADTVRIELSYLRAALKYAEKMKRIPKAPFVVVPSSGEAREHWLTEDEVSRLIEGAKEVHVKLFIILSVTTAARPSHILQLKWDRVRFDDGYIDLRNDDAAKNKRRPRVPINATCLKHLKIADAIKRTDYVIEFNGKGGFDSIKNGIARAAERSGVKASPYVLRHTAGVWMAKAGVLMQEISALMGHKNLKTTMKHYAHYQPDFLRSASSALEITSHGPAE